MIAIIILSLLAIAIIIHAYRQGQLEKPLTRNKTVQNALY